MNDLCEGFLGVSLLGDASGTYAVAPFGTASGTFPVSVTGTCANTFETFNWSSGEYETVAYSGRCVDVQVDDASQGYYAGISILDDARGPIALSVAGNSHAAPMCVGYHVYAIYYIACGKEGGALIASGTGDAHGTNATVGASGTGEAYGGAAAISVLGPATHSDWMSTGPAISVTGPARSCDHDFYGCFAVSAFGNAEGETAVSLFGHASGDRALSACDAMDALCVDLPGPAQ